MARCSKPRVPVEVGVKQGRVGCGRPKREYVDGGRSIPGVLVEAGL